MTDKEIGISLSVTRRVFEIGLFTNVTFIYTSITLKPLIMPGRQAKTLSSADVNDLLVFASCTRNPLRNRVLVLLSAKAGLRASEIANLTWDMVLGPTGQISGIIELQDTAAKKGNGRVIPMHPDLCCALENLRRVAAHLKYVVTSERGHSRHCRWGSGRLDRPAAAGGKQPGWP
jgi:integrase